jgi:hypothetical protein
VPFVLHLKMHAMREGEIKDDDGGSEFKYDIFDIL